MKSILLDDKQINKAEASLRQIVSGMLNEEIAINYKDYQQSCGKKILYTGSVTVRQSLRMVSSLRYYKKQSEELRKALETAKEELLWGDAENAIDRVRTMIDKALERSQP